MLDADGYMCIMQRALLMQYFQSHIPAYVALVHKFGASLCAASLCVVSLYPTTPLPLVDAPELMRRELEGCNANSRSFSGTGYNRSSDLSGYNR